MQSEQMKPADPTPVQVYPNIMHYGVAIVVLIILIVGAAFVIRRPR